MLKLLLQTNTNMTLLVISLVMLSLILAIPMGIYIREKMTETKTKEKEKTGKIHVDIKQPFLPPRLYKFFVRVRKVLPKEYIVFPRVGMDMLVDTHGSSDVYNKILGEHVDFCVFNAESMKPVAVIDVIDPQVSMIPVTKQSEVIRRVFEQINLPILEFDNSKDYEDQDILKSFLRTLDPLELELIKRNRSE